LSQLSEELRANKKKILSKPSDDSKTVKKYTNKLSEDLKTNKKRTSVFNVLFCFAGCDFSSELNTSSTYFLFDADSFLVTTFGSSTKIQKKQQMK
jgi:uncharacterized protein YbgA (DUF1722 family)